MSTYRDNPASHIDYAEILLEELTEQWRVGDPNSRIKLAQTHALIAIAQLLNTSALPPRDAQQCREATGARRCTKRAGHVGWHDDGNTSWPRYTITDEAAE